jgi:hypothetical protein
MKLWKLIVAIFFLGLTNAADAQVSLQVSRCGSPSGGFVPFCVNDGAGAQIPLLSINPSTHKLGMSPSVLTIPSFATPGILTNNSSGVVSSSNAITLNQTHSGSAPLANWSSITIPIDTVTPCDFCTDFNITHHIQSLVRGARSSGFNWIIQDNVPTSGSNVTVLVGSTLIGQSNAGDGGTATTNAGARGTYFGANTIARNAGPNIISVVGIESDIQTTAASSSRYTFGYSAVNYEAAQSVALDAAFAIYSGGSIDASGGSGPWGPGIGFHCGICFSEISANGLVPLDAGATVLGTHLESLSTIPAGIGIDLTGFTFSGAAYKSNLFTVTQGGSIFAQAYWANGSQGVTKVCTVLPTVVGGIITAC